MLSYKKEQRRRREAYSLKSNQISFLDVGFAIKASSVTLLGITGRYQCTTQSDGDVGSRDSFKMVPANYRDISMKVNELRWEKVSFQLSVE